MISKRVLSLVKTSPLFRGVGPEALERFVATARVRAVPMGHHLTTGLHDAQHAVLLVGGKVRMELTLGDGRHTLLRVAGAGELLSPVLLTSDAVGVRTTAMALCEVLDLSQTEFRRVAASDDCLFENFYEQVRRDWQALAELVVAETRDNAAQRIGRFLFRAIDPSHQVPQEETAKIVGITQRDVANATGLTRETVNKTLHGWSDRGLVRTDRRLIEFLDVPALARTIQA